MADLSIISVTQLKGVGSRVSECLKKLGISTAADLLWHLPMRYQDRTRITPIRELKVGQSALIEANIVTSQIQFGKKRSLLCTLQDRSGVIQLRFFYFNTYQQQQLSIENTTLRCFGLVTLTRQGLSMVHPEYQVVTDEEDLVLDQHYSPIYPTTEGISQKLWRKLMAQVISRLQNAVGIQDFIPQTLLQEMQLPDLLSALQLVHQPLSTIPLIELNLFRHPAQRRLALEELLAHQLSLKQNFSTSISGEAIALFSDQKLEQQFLQQLPFQLTNAQQRVIKEVQKDLQSQRPMLRLVQGDVGSGKTVVAAVSALSALAQGKQVALMAPTELLAEQHYQNFQSWFKPLGFSAVLLTGSLSKKHREEHYALIREGKAQLIIGTHALFQESVHYHQLALMIVDEQQRFGVHQRLSLREKNAQSVPHQLIMTATPIPRTLAMTLFTDLPISIIDELPPGRKPISTVAIPNNRRAEVIERIKQNCAQGRQVYWICTLIEESELLDGQAAEETHQLLTTLLSGLRIGLVHGRMKSDQKEQALLAFREHQYDVLVATTVVEVGVDVPNASLMIIENPERLGLSQLHQLRGRVGRGEAQSFCALLYQSPLNEYAKERLDILRQTNDGFVIAEKDLELRGPGEILGVRQAGEMIFKVADLSRDQDLLPIVQHMADSLQLMAPEMVDAIIQRWIGSHAVFAVV